jgi:glycosyltransferase involved in cell wall biosynthesis
MYKSLDFRRKVSIAEGYTEHRHLHPFHELLKAPMLFGYPNVFQSKALQLVNNSLGRMLDKADIVLVREPWQTPYVFDRTDNHTPVIFSSHNVETERFGDISQPAFERWFEARIDDMEKQSVQGADAVVCTSDRDADTYRQKYDPSCPIIVAPNGTYQNNLRDHRPESKRATQIRNQYDIPLNATVCLFMGSNYKPNIEAVMSVCEVAMELSDRVPPVHFLILGSVGHAFNTGSTPDNVVITGYVEENFEAYFDAADIALNPMCSGGGTNIKLIDYFARSLPVITTPFGVRGLDVRGSKDAIIAEIDDFVDAIDNLREKQSRLKTLGSAGRRLAAKKYTWESTSQQLRNRLYELFGPF